MILFVLIYDYVLDFTEICFMLNCLLLWWWNWG